MEKNILPTGLHKLSGIDSYQRKNEYETYDGYYVVIDDVVYAFEIDPCDGYRSYGDVQVVDIPLEVIKNRFPSQEVFISYVSKNSECEYGEVKELYIIMDTHTAKPVLEIGTDYTDDYYPMAIFHYHPENMAINGDTTDKKVNAVETMQRRWGQYLKEELASSVLKWHPDESSIDINEEIKEQAHWLANKFSVRNGYTSTEEVLLEMAEFVKNRMLDKL